MDDFMDIELKVKKKKKKRFFLYVIYTPESLGRKFVFNFEWKYKKPRLTGAVSFIYVLLVMIYAPCLMYSISRHVLEGVVSKRPDIP